MRFFFLFFLFVLPLSAQEVSTATAASASDEGMSENSTAIRKLVVAAWKISSRISPDPQKLNYVFDRSFFNYISQDKMTAIFKELYNQNGSVVEVSSVSYKGGLTANFFLYTDKGYVIPASVTVEDKKWKVTGLFFQPSFRKTSSLSDTTSAFEKMPYSLSALLVKKMSGLEDNIYARNETKPAAIGSAFKLYVLAWLVENEVSWDKILRMSASVRSLPSGRLQNMPDKTPFTVFSLAQAMISESDNTAADMLIDFIGREKIEQSLPNFFNSWQKLNTPFLKTSEMFKLKADPQLLSRYALSDVKGRRKILRELEKKSLPSPDFLDPGKPIAISSVEWFASMEDICRLMDYFRKKNNPQVNAILSLNGGLDVKTPGFKFAAYKGGSEPGVLSMNWLLQSKSGTWYCVAGAVNDEKIPVNQKDYFQLMQATLNQVGSEIF
ncbi:MAG: hypothetical protein Fur0012_02440 [Elusimicrobiota bacterium]